MPISETELQKIVSHFDNKLPTGYLKLLKTCNGGEGELKKQEIFFRLWSADETIEANRDLSINEFLPNFVAFGGDGGNELYTFKINSDETRIFMIPMIVMNEEDAIDIAENFTEFVNLIKI